MVAMIKLLLVVVHVYSNGEKFKFMRHILGDVSFPDVDEILKERKSSQ